MKITEINSDFYLSRKTICSFPGIQIWVPIIAYVYTQYGETENRRVIIKTAKTQKTMTKGHKNEHQKDINRHKATIKRHKMR